MLKLKHNWRPILAIILLILLLFWLTRCNTPKPIDNAAYLKKIDSIVLELKFANQRIEAIDYRIYQSDSSLAQSYKKLNNRINEIKRFTPDTRNRFRDSVRLANNL